MKLKCILFPEQTKIEIWSGHDFIGYVKDEKLTWFSNGNDLVDLSFIELDVIRDNWNQMVELQRKEKIFPCPHCGFVGREGKSHQLGPEDKSAICGSCGNPFNIGPED